jgi:hypothetical protein
MDGLMTEVEARLKPLLVRAEFGIGFNTLQRAKWPFYED